MEFFTLLFNHFVVTLHRFPDDRLQICEITPFIGCFLYADLGFQAADDTKVSPSRRHCHGRGIFCVLFCVLTKIY